MKEHETFDNWLKEHARYAADAQNLSEAELHSRINRLPQYHHEGPTGPDGYVVVLRDNNSTSSRFPADSRKESLVKAFLLAVYKRWADTPWDTTGE